MSRLVLAFACPDQSLSREQGVHCRHTPQRAEKLLKVNTHLHLLRLFN